MNMRMSVHPESSSENAETFFPHDRDDPVKSPTKEDPWKHLLDPLLKKGKERCDAWKDEVQNLLIFAGLFSAIATGFLIEVHKSLKQDDGEVLLGRILARLDFVANGTTAQLDTFKEADKFLPKASNQRINAFWFISLVFSLATVLIGIVALQWIREYQRTHDDKEMRTWFSLHHMYTEALDEWYIPQIFTFLPLLLQIGLILFLIGLAEFVWELDIAVAIPTIISIALTLMFLVVTTMIPTLQALKLFSSSLRPRNKPPRVQCPYKSPQAWLFHRLVILAVRFFALVPVKAVRQFFLHKDRREMLSSKVFHFPIHNIFFASRQESEHLWHLHGIGWLFQRDLDQLHRTPHLEQSEGHIKNLSPQVVVPQYDAIRALSRIRDGLTTTKDQHIFANVCFSELCSKYGSRDKKDDGRAYGEYIHHMLMDPEIGNADGWRRYRLRVPVSQSSPQPSAVLRESNEFTFRSPWNSKAARRNIITSHGREDLIERAIRLINWMFSDEPRPVDKAKADFSMDYTPVTLLAHEVAADPKYFYESKLQHPLQLAKVVHFFLESARNFNYTSSLAPTSFTSEYTNEFLSVSAQVLGVALSEESKAAHKIGLTPQLDATMTDAAATLHEWVNTIRPTVSTTAQNRPDYLFFVLYIFESNLPTTYNRPELRTAITDYINYLRSQDPSSLDTNLTNALKIDWDLFTADWETRQLEVPSPTARDHVEVVPPSAAVDRHYRLPINTPSLEQLSFTALSDNPVPNEIGGQSIPMQPTNVSSPRISLAELQPLLSDPEARPTDRHSIDNSSQWRKERAGSEPRIDIVTAGNKSLSRLSIPDPSHHPRDSGVGPSPSGRVCDSLEL